MKSKYLNKLTLATLALSLGMLACVKEKEIRAPWTNAGADSEFAHLRIVHASPNFRNITGQADSIHVFANGVKINGARLTYGGLFPGQTPATYAGIAPGSVALKISVGGIDNLDSIPVATINANLEKGKNYSLIITDSLLNASKDSTRIFVWDSFPTPANIRVGLRFIHSLVDTATDKRVDVWSARRNANIFAAIQPGAVTNFTNQPFINFPDTLIVRRTGTTTELARINTITLANTKVYTLFLRGDVRLTGTKARTLTWYTNR
jgi:hypothetical protein